MKEIKEIEEVKAVSDARKDFNIARGNYIAAKRTYIAAHNALYRVTKK